MLTFVWLALLKKKVLKIMQDIESSNLAGADKRSREFLKDDTCDLAKPVSGLCNLSIS